jgi:hypothetical protein
MSTLYRNPRAWRARVAQAALWIGAIAIAAAPLNSPPMTGGDQAIYAVGVLLVLGCAIAVEFFLRRYVVAIERAPDGALFTTLTTFGTMQRKRGRGEIRHAGARHDNTYYPGAPSVDNHWIALHRADGKFAYVLDVTPPATIDDKALRAALG